MDKRVEDACDAFIAAGRTLHPEEAEWPSGYDAEEQAEFRQLMAAALAAADAVGAGVVPEGGEPINTAPCDGTEFIALSEDLTGSGLPPFLSRCAWHPDAGFCTDELRQPTRWWPATKGLTAVPEGYRLVPVDPTHEMLSRGAYHVLLTAGSVEEIDMSQARAVYRAMLAAAPSTPLRTEEEIRADERERRAKIARDGCLVPPDGGSPTEAESAMCDRIAAAIRKNGRKAPAEKPNGLLSWNTPPHFGAALEALCREDKL